MSNVDGRVPVVSQEFKPGVHLGVDIMFRRVETDPPYASSDPRGTRAFYVPLGALACATQDGTVIYAKDADNGFRVRVATMDGYEELHLHLGSLFVQDGEDVVEGQPLGELGGDPTTADPHHTVHLHYERRLGNVPEDPAPYLAGLAAPLLAGGGALGGVGVLLALVGAALLVNA